MDLYHIWCDLKSGVGDVAFCERVDAFLDKLRDEGAIVRHRITRRKLGFGPGSLGEFHIQVEVHDLAQLDAAFGRAATRSEPIESLHQAVNSVATNLSFALYRDFPDATRVRGQEKF